MCGIAGIAYTDPQVEVSEQILRNMTSTMMYRVPDDGGYYLSKDRKKASEYFSRFNSNERCCLFRHVLEDVTRDKMMPEQIKQ